MSALPQPPAVAQTEAYKPTLVTREIDRRESQTAEGYKILDESPCGGGYSGETGSFFQANTVKPNICLLGDKSIGMDLTCTGTELNATLFQRTLLPFQLTMAHFASGEQTGFDASNTTYQSLCVGPSEEVVPSSHGAVTMTPPGPCVEIRISEKVDSSHPELRFSAGGVADILDSLSVLPGVDQPMQCRIDIHTRDGVHFGEGCITNIESAYKNEHPASCPGIPQYNYVPGSGGVSTSR